MDSQDKRMCKAESSFSGGTVEYNHDVYDEDCFGDILNIFDFPMENLEGDGLAEDWASKLGPIPSEVFREMLPPVSQIGLGNGNGNGNGNVSSADLLPEYSVSNARTSQLKRQSIHQEETFKGYKVQRTSQHKQQPTSFDEKKPNLLPGSFEAPSPNSVLESRSSSSSSKSISFGIEVSVPARTRSKRSRPTTNPWLLSPLIIPQNKDQKKKRRNRAATAHHHHRRHHPAAMETKNPLERSNPAAGVKKCTHCEITKTPQWREGPMGPKTLCNACGVRYRSGRLFPEYRPAASPTFVPSLHSNSHRKVIEMRQKVNGIQKGVGTGAGKDGNYGLL